MIHLIQTNFSIVSKHRTLFRAIDNKSRLSVGPSEQLFRVKNGGAVPVKSTPVLELLNPGPVPAAALAPAPAPGGAAHVHPRGGGVGPLRDGEVDSDLLSVQLCSVHLPLCLDISIIRLRN